jgi:hypothetical protein
MIFTEGSFRRAPDMGKCTMIKRVRLNQKADSKSRSLARAPEPSALFGEPQLLEGEDAATYRELLARIRRAINPIDIIDEMFIAEIAALEWEVLRWRRLKTSLIRAHGLQALENFLRETLECDMYSDRFVDDLREIVQKKLPKHQPKDLAERLAHEYAPDELEAAELEVLDNFGVDLDQILKDAKIHKAKDLVQQYVQHESDAVRLVDELLAKAGTSMDALLVNSLERDFDYIERIDHLTAVAEARRNASLREIDRRRALFGEALRKTLPEVEGEFEVIEAKPAKGEKAA